MSSKILKKGTVCYGSTLGYYNFHYPDFSRKYELRIPVKVEYLTWATRQGFQAYKVESPTDYLPIGVLWIHE